ncbi:hypothetical protein JYT44_03355, partial [Caldithrix abyssi]|nr:hypothetical protein [Caldithrix abyssi]
MGPKITGRIKLFAQIFIAVLTSSIYGQYLSHLNANKDDAIFTTYAAPLPRSAYKIDQGYHLEWYRSQDPVMFKSERGGSLGLAFRLNDDYRNRLYQLYTEPVITATYSDMVKFYYYPFQNVRVDVFFTVYSSALAIMQIEIVNEGDASIQLEIYPYYDHGRGQIENLQMVDPLAFGFEFVNKRDAWMDNHNIPLIENLKSIYLIDHKTHGKGVYESEDSFLRGINELEGTSDISGGKFLIFRKDLLLAPGEQKSIRVVRGLGDAQESYDQILSRCKQTMDVNLENILRDNEKTYSRIPVLNFSNKDYENLYWNAFSLIRQCIMPPEGACSYNYYVFSREPKWGWGYGGQVFHESLVMLAYAYMDPESAMNSQRVYMERQEPNGYINYRTGPYLNEQIEHNGDLTSSAPWYNYQNYEIFKITGDKKFLEQAYFSGKKFYNYFSSRRDSNKNGLSEWGAHAVLESVRDGRVAVWDRVDWPSNFEGPDINAMMVMEAKALANMALELGFTDEEQEWKSNAEQRRKLINRYLWDRRTGFYYNIDKNDLDFSFKNKNDLKIKEIIGFLPLWAGVATKKQADRLIKVMTDPDEFWRPFGVPTLTARDEYYNPIGYWNGPIWIQWQYLLFRGLLDYGYVDEAVELAERVIDNVIHQLKVDHNFWEFYSADDYQAGWNKTYIWTGIVARMLIDLDQINESIQSRKKRKPRQTRKSLSLERGAA